MAVPKKRKTPRRTKQGRSHHALTTEQFAKCPNCGNATRPHYPCPNCGNYKGRKVV